MWFESRLYQKAILCEHFLNFPICFDKNVAAVPLLVATVVSPKSIIIQRSWIEQVQMSLSSGVKCWESETSLRPDRVVLKDGDIFSYYSAVT
jgi:hypothetical protein